MKAETFKGTDIKLSDLTQWLLDKFKRFKISEIRYFGSRIKGEPRENSDFDTYILFDGKAAGGGKPIFTEIYYTTEKGIK